MQIFVKTCADFGNFVHSANKYRGKTFPGTVYSTCEVDKDADNNVVCWIRIKNDKSTDVEVQHWLEGPTTFCRYAMHNGYRGQVLLRARIRRPSPERTESRRSPRPPVLPRGTLSQDQDH
uniref:Uncharacterized protein n=1 Tax=Cacopsylla melanoneura TaxID=428564 RepID=A0A8D8XVF6_9HEMI